MDVETAACFCATAEASVASVLITVAVVSLFLAAVNLTIFASYNLVKPINRRWV